MKKRLVLVVVLVVALALAMAVPALAASVASGGARGKLVVDITYKVPNNWASGPIGSSGMGVWGLKDEVLRTQVWQTGAHSFYQVASWEGRWRTFAGAPSPLAGIPQGRDGVGTVRGHMTWTFTAPGLAPVDNLPVRGYIGTFDARATKADIGKPGAFPPGMFGFGENYFPGMTDFVFLDFVQIYTDTTHYSNSSHGYRTHPTFVQYLLAPGSPPSFAFKGDIVIQ